MRKIAVIWFGLLVLAGCAQDRGATLSCKGPDATGCEPLSKVYERETATSATVVPLLLGKNVPYQFAAEINSPQLEPARIVRVWLAPWEDSNGDLHDHQYLYLVLRAPRWQINSSAVTKELKATPPATE